jgi:ABC-type histidine transport system ATPase subunit
MAADHPGQLSGSAQQRNSVGRACSVRAQISDWAEPILRVVVHLLSKPASLLAVADDDRSVGD